jgi:lactate dehydrogenase-like 2-hydroxyacid dehydrogenase
MEYRRRIGIIATRLAGTDGVSLETAKWVKVLTALGNECY